MTSFENLWKYLVDKDIDLPSADKLKQQTIDNQSTERAMRRLADAKVADLNSCKWNILAAMERGEFETKCYDVERSQTWNALRELGYDTDESKKQVSWK